MNYMQIYWQCYFA